MSSDNKKKKVFVDGPVSPGFIADSIAKHSTKKEIGAHAIFLGQVRNDILGNGTVAAIEYTSYEEMADDEFHRIREEAFAKFELTCMHIYHSLGIVKAGEISLFVFVSSKHRKPVFPALEWIVDEIKTKAPVWGKEIFEDGTHVWKQNN